MDLLPAELMLEVLRHAREYGPALRAVCRAWRAACASDAALCYSANHGGSALSIRALAMRGHDVLLCWVRELTAVDAKLRAACSRTCALDDAWWPLTDAEAARWPGAADEVLRGAALGGHHDLVQFALDRGCSLWARETAYVSAASRGHVQVMQMLIPDTLSRACVRIAVPPGDYSAGDAPTDIAGANATTAAFLAAAAGGHAACLALAWSLLADAGDNEVMIRQACRALNAATHAAACASGGLMLIQLRELRRTLVATQMPRAATESQRVHAHHLSEAEELIFTCGGLAEGGHLELLMANLQHPSHPQWRPCIRAAHRSAARGGHARVVHAILAADPVTARTEATVDRIARGAAEGGHIELYRLAIALGHGPSSETARQLHRTALAAGFTEFAQLGWALGGYSMQPNALLEQAYRHGLAPLLRLAHARGAATLAELYAPAPPELTDDWLGVDGWGSAPAGLTPLPTPFSPDTLVTTLDQATQVYPIARPKRGLKGVEARQGLNPIIDRLDAVRIARLARRIGLDIDLGRLLDAALLRDDVRLVMLTLGWGAPADGAVFARARLSACGIVVPAVSEGFDGGS